MNNLAVRVDAQYAHSGKAKSVLFALADAIQFRAKEDKNLVALGYARQLRRQADERE